MRSCGRLGARAAAAALAAVVLAGCATSPLGRNQLILFPDTQMDQMGEAAYRDLKRSTPRETDRSAIDYVQCVTDHVLGALERDQHAGWEVTVFADDQVNAFALPGGKIGVYRGLLDVAENQDQLATVIAHEVAHVLARHSNERVSTSFVTQTGLQVVQVAAGGASQARSELFGLLGVGAQYGVLLPFNRRQESEADLVGLDLMARAGFDPRQSVYLWQNMVKKGGPRPPEFLSTHPSGQTRIRDLNARMDRAMQLSLAARSARPVPDCRR